ncbi:interferon-induced GTP-binding protein Mx2 [Parathielavia appendiculata]|uniref:Interferon-induced GTP-binding protein Mx2 n=1 Tax=Parathielavia appendiculata TaxID=2587402 RepID=A0AAN6TPB2_9PEZI|nr:interferon-induced GTP-binding protein Mx2 [Parathielavia appendiculata]
MTPAKDENIPAVSLGSPALLDKFDRLRDLNISHLVSLPQLVVVGDQSSGKSSVLESLTGFPFPRAPGLCTRYVTQITCRRVNQESVAISIIPGAGASTAHKDKLRAFHAETTDVYGENFARIFREASTAMDGKPDGDKSLDTFSDDILKIEITGPNQFPLTVIDVPGIFRTATPGMTTENDMALVRAMVERAIKDDRTIILAVVPCNVDIATQEILKLATDADPTGLRTMGVLTKPDLATERATQQVIIDLVLGKRNDLKLGYCVVKNRSADDDLSSLQDRDDAEKVFFKSEPWCQLESSGRIGIGALRQRLSGLIQSITRREFPRVRDDVQKKLHATEEKLKALGDSRADTMSQRYYLAEVARRFQDIVGDALDAKYTRHYLFNDSDLKLITRIMEFNDAFAANFAMRGHSQHFDKEHDGSSPSGVGQETEDESSEPGSSHFPELNDILLNRDYVCAEPQDNIMDCIKEVYRSSRGPELGTFGGSLLSMTFKVQTEKWERLVHSHTSAAIVLVHTFIVKTLKEVCHDERTRTELWDTLLLEKLQRAYKKAMDHAKFLLDVERNGKPVTLNNYFSDRLEHARGDRYQARIKKVGTVLQHGNARGWWLSQTALNQVALTKSGNVDHVCKKLHDILQSYYNVSRKRFVDVVCQYVVYHFLLDSEGSPLRLFDTKLVLGLSDEKLDAIAGEDATVMVERERLGQEVKSLKAAIKILRS